MHYKLANALFYIIHLPATIKYRFAQAQAIAIYPLMKHGVCNDFTFRIATKINNDFTIGAIHWHPYSQE